VSSCATRAPELPRTAPHHHRASQAARRLHLRQLCGCFHLARESGHTTTGAKSEEENVRARKEGDARLCGVTLLTSQDGPEQAGVRRGLGFRVWGLGFRV
jgi:hypothetical protein